MNTTQTVITDELPVESWVVVELTDGHNCVLAPTEEAAARGRAYLETAHEPRCGHG